jgi:hypothetical protein
MRYQWTNDDLLSYVGVDDDRMSAAELVSIDDGIPMFNQWADGKEAIREMVEVYAIDEPEFVEEEESSGDIAPKLPEALGMAWKLHLFASIEHPELHSLLSELESKMVDVYLDWKSSKQCCITDYFRKN